MVLTEVEKEHLEILNKIRSKEEKGREIGQMKIGSLVRSIFFT